MRDDFEQFCKNFDIVDNSLKQRQLVRWNGRDLRQRENLAEHSHLVVACAIELMEFLSKKTKYEYNALRVIKLAMIHDGLELLRGDILSITKDAIPGLRDEVDKEESVFLRRMICNLGTPTELENWILKLSDLKACYKFIESELRFPNNNFSKQVYKDTKEKYDEAFKSFCSLYNITIPHQATIFVKNRLLKGYEDDAGVDIILDEDVTFMPMSTESIGLRITFTPEEGTMGLLCARTSASAKGLTVAMCPIDPHYTGEVIAIVSNVSNEIVEYKKGESFCQIIQIPFVNSYGIPCKRPGKRSNGKLGSTGV